TWTTPPASTRSTRCPTTSSSAASPSWVGRWPMAERPSRPYLVGYPDRLSVRPGDDVEVMAATDRPGRAAASLVRLGAGEVTGAVRETVIADLGDVDVERQWTQNGSFMVVPGASHPWPAGPFVAAVLAMPTRFG